MLSRYLASWTVVTLLGSACTDVGVLPVTSRVVINPYGTAPLAAVIVVLDLVNVDAVRTLTSLSVVPKTGPCPPWSVTYEPQSDAFLERFAMTDLIGADEIGVPVLGLCPDTRHEVTFTLGETDEQVSGTVIIDTSGAVTYANESVHIEVFDETQMEPGWTYINGRVYDNEGNLRWVGERIYQILDNGNFLSKLNEMDWLGRVVNEWTLPAPLRWHHDAFEMPSGNFLVLTHNDETLVVDNRGDEVYSIYDYVVELDRESGDIVNAWDLRAFMDVDRGTVIVKSRDWVHTNTVIYDSTTDSIIVSARHQGIIKLTRDGMWGDTPNLGKSLVWILAPKLDWGRSGWDGLGEHDLNDYLLTAVDENGVPYSVDVQNNLAIVPDESSDFHWVVGQHGLAIRTDPDTLALSLLTFNNQGSFIFDGPGSVDNGVYLTGQGDLLNDHDGSPYSVMVEYTIDQAAGTVTEAASFGADDPNLYGSYSGGVRWFEASDNRLMISNGVDPFDDKHNPLNANVIEVTSTGEVVFRLSISQTEMSAYRAGRVDLLSALPVGVSSDAM